MCIRCIKHHFINEDAMKHSWEKSRSYTRRFCSRKKAYMNYIGIGVRIMQGNVGEVSRPRYYTPGKHFRIVHRTKFLLLSRIQARSLYFVSLFSSAFLTRYSPLCVLPARYTLHIVCILLTSILTVLTAEGSFR